MKILVVDVGGSHVKVALSGVAEVRRFRSGKDLTPEACVRQVLAETNDWTFEVVSLGYPGRVTEDGPAAEPGNLSDGWVSFDYEAHFGRPVRVVNDAVMQALGGYDGGRMLFLGLGYRFGIRSSDRPRSRPARARNAAMVSARHSRRSGWPSRARAERTRSME